MVPPRPHRSHTFFCLLVWDAYHVVGTTRNDRRSLRNTFEWMRALQAPSSSLVECWWRSRGLVPWKLQRICILRYVILGVILPNNRWMVMHFFMCIAVQSHRKIPKVQSFQFSSFLSEKSVNVFLNVRVTDQCQDRPSTSQHLSDFSKNVLFFTIS